MIQSKAITVLQSNKLESTESLVNQLHAQNIPIIRMKQVHGKHIHSITKLPEQSLDITIPDCDGLITTVPNLAISVKHADCMPILIYHPFPALSVLHAGRKSSDLHILEEALTALIKLTGSKTNYNLHFGPHICLNCFEIQRSPSKHYSLIEKNKTIFQNCLDPKKNTLTIDSTCTCCGNNYYSYRGDNHTEKRNVQIAYINPKTSENK